MNRLAPVHPGEILQEEISSLEISASRLAQELKVPVNRITMILRGQRGVTADTALRLARYFNTTAEFWLNLQVTYDLKSTEITSGAQIKKDIKPHH